jgi:hypothetical protein
MHQNEHFFFNQNELPYSMTPPLPCPSPFRPNQQDELTRCLSAFTVPTFLPSPFVMPNSPESLNVDIMPAMMSQSSFDSDQDRCNSFDSNDSYDLASPRRHSSVVMKKLQCPEVGCNASFAVSKHLRRHKMKHAPHRHRCTVPNCSQTSYRSDIMKQHEKSHRRALEKMGTVQNTYITDLVGQGFY